MVRWYGYGALATDWQLWMHWGRQVLCVLCATLGPSGARHTWERLDVAMIAGLSGCRMPSARTILCHTVVTPTPETRPPWTPAYLCIHSEGCAHQEV